MAVSRCGYLPADYRITGNTVLCYCCGLRSFRELTYQYRQNIPASELPGKESVLSVLASLLNSNRYLTWLYTPYLAEVVAWRQKTSTEEG